MENEELVKLAQDVAACLVRAKALGEEITVTTLTLALDELLERLAVERERLAQVAPELEEELGQ